MRRYSRRPGGNSSGRNPNAGFLAHMSPGLNVWLPPKWAARFLRHLPATLLVAGFLGNSSCPAFADDGCKDIVDRTSIERRVWLRLCEAGEAHLAAGESISADFLRSAVLAGFTSAKTRGIHLFGGSVTGPLLLHDVAFNGPTLRISSQFDQLVDLDGSQFDGSVSFRGSSLLGGVSARRAVVKGSLQFGELDDDIYDGTRRPGGLPIQFLKAAHIRVDGDVVVAGATINDSIDLSLADIKGSLAVMYVIAKSVDISASAVANQLIFYSFSTDRRVVTSRTGVAPADEGLNLFSIRSKQSVYINRSVIRGEVTLEDAEIEGDLVLLGNELTSLKARSVNVKNSLIIGVNDGPPELPMRWAGQSILDLTSAHLGSIRAPEEESAWPTGVYFRNLTFSLYTADFCGHKDCAETSDWFASWLAKQRDEPVSFAPYKLVVDALMGQGRTLDAQDLGVKGRDAEREYARTHAEPLRYMILSLFKYSVGYGYRPGWSLYWIAVFVVAGAVVFRTSPQAKENRMPFGLAFSFDQLIPLVKLREEHYKIQLLGWRRYYFYGHKIMGWVLGGLLAAALSVITK